MVKSCAAGEPPAFMIGGYGFCSGLGWLQTILGVEAFAVEIELLVVGPGLLQEVEPFGGVFVAVVVRAHVGAEHVELVLEPAAHDVDGEASAW